MTRYSDISYELLNEKLNAMASRVQEVIKNTIDALVLNDPSLAKEMIQADEEIDRAELEIDELVINLLALRQPMATDLRFIITALKLNNELERMGDQATNIAQGVLLLQSEPDANQVVDLGPMEDVVQEMVRGCLDAYTQRNSDLARAVCKKDEVVDQMNSDIIAKLASFAQANPQHANRCISLVLITRNLERIGDLCTNIAEDVVYYIEGRSIKHAH